MTPDEIAAARRFSNDLPAYVDRAEIQGWIERLCDECERLQRMERQLIQKGYSLKTILETDATKRFTKDQKGQSTTRTYQAWKNMRKRCLYEKHPYYKNYGGRGIKVHEPWLDYQKFLADMGECPPAYSLERRDIDGNYEPSNCAWLPRHLQARNQRNSVYLEAKGDRRLLVEWAELNGIPPATIRSRINRGWTPERAVTEPRKAGRK